MIYDTFDLNSLKIFISVYENEGIVQASKKLFLSQPAVTISIKKLEERMGGKLFIRLPKGIKPTPEGKMFYEFCKEGLMKINSGIKNFSSTSFFSKGSLNIGTDTSLAKFLMPKIKEFVRLYPQVKISFTEVLEPRLQKYLTREDIDIAFELGPIKNSEVFDCYKIGTYENVFISAKQKEMSEQELFASSFALLKENTSHRTSLNLLMQKHSVKPNIQFETANFVTLVNIVKNTNSVGFAVKELVQEELNNGEVFELKTNFEIPQTQLYALLPKGNNNSYICEKFLSLF